MSYNHIYNLFYQDDFKIKDATTLSSFILKSKKNDKITIFENLMVTLDLTKSNLSALNSLVRYSYVFRKEIPSWYIFLDKVITLYHDNKKKTALTTLRKFA